MRAIREKEISIVKARARLVRGAKEFARISSLIPFPLQTWFLSIPAPRRESGRMTAGVVLNALIAAFAAVCALIGSAGAIALLWIGVIAQGIGGVTYRTAGELEPPPDTFLRRVWLVQIVGLALTGSALTISSSIEHGRPTMLLSSALWLGLGYVFILGMLIYDALGRNWFATAELDTDLSPDP